MRINASSRFTDTQFTWQKSAKAFFKCFIFLALDIPTAPINALKRCTQPHVQLMPIGRNLQKKVHLWFFFLLQSQSCRHNFYEFQELIVVLCNPIRHTIPMLVLAILHPAKSQNYSRHIVRDIKAFIRLFQRNNLLSWPLSKRILQLPWIQTKFAEDSYAHGSHASPHQQYHTYNKTRLIRKGMSLNSSNANQLSALITVGLEYIFYYLHFTHFRLILYITFSIITSG